MRVSENTFLRGKTWLLVLEATDIVDKVRGGHFLMIEVSKTYDPLGRRAFAVGDVRGEELYIFYDVVGRGTHLMTELRPGEEVGVFGPLGKRLFSYEGDKHLLIGGGIGLAGLSLLGKELRRMGKEVVFVYGARSAEYLSMIDWLKEEGFSYEIYTDDGSLGKRGVVTQALENFGPEWVVSACGPKPMLKALKREAQKKGHKLYLSLEERMACGWGVCLGCVVKDKHGSFKRVCYEGPVFAADEVIL